MPGIHSIKRTKKCLWSAGFFLCFILSLRIESPAFQASTDQPYSHAAIQSSPSPDASTDREGEYFRMQQALLKYRKIASDGGWPVISKGKPMKKGEQGERIALLRKRLFVTGDFSGKSTENEGIFDEELHNAVMRFQKRHGLKEDGVAGPETLKSINIPAEERIHQIEINLERLRNIGKDMGKRFIRVNIAAFELEVVEDEDTVMTMKIIAGKPYWYTPVFSAEMTHLIFNPSWYVPKSIAVREILPKVRKEPDYLNSEGFKVYRDSGIPGKEVDVSAVDWSSVTSENFRYRFVQPPGPRNPLGRIKFVFPNRFNVYLHDTPARLLFEKSSRAFSHGCIRIEKPVELAEYLLREDPSWTRQRMLAEIDNGIEMKVRLPSPVTVHILYLTAWVDKEGILHFRKDIYGRDRRTGGESKKN